MVQNAEFPQLDALEKRLANFKAKVEILHDEYKHPIRTWFKKHIFRNPSVPPNELNSRGRY